MIDNFNNFNDSEYIDMYKTVIINLFRTTNHKEFDISLKKYIITYKLIEECFK